MLLGIVVSILGILGFLFLYWKRLKEDYSSDIIFQSALYILIGIEGAWIIADRFFPLWFFWAVVLGVIAGLGMSIARFKVKFYETLEAVIISTLPWLGFVFLKSSVEGSSLSSFFAFLAMLAITFLAYWIDTHYKSFTWYRSGRIGFTGLAIAIIFFFTRSLLAIVKVPVLSFVGRFEGVVSGALVFICSLLLYNLAKYKK